MPLKRHSPLVSLNHLSDVAIVHSYPIAGRTLCFITPNRERSGGIGRRVRSVRSNRHYFSFCFASFMTATRTLCVC